MILEKDSIMLPEVVRKKLFILFGKNSVKILIHLKMNET